ncbi:MAG: hypothetical protein KOO61_07500 [Spirochaetales bacterium]|nr:hypothetical protein [Spirochaetales bacterium]
MAVSEEQNQQETSHSVDESELEQYGVWVKAGPEDVIEAEAEDEAFTLDDLSEDALVDAESELLASEESTGDATIDALSDELEEVSLDSLEAEPDSVDFSDEPDEVELDTFDLGLDDDSTAPEIAFDLDDSDLLTLEEEDLTVDLGQESEEPGGLEEDLTLEDLTEEEAVPAELASEPAALSAGDGGGVVDDDLNIEEDLPDNLDDLTLDLDDLDVDSFEETSPGSPEEPGEELGEVIAADEETAELFEESLETPEEVAELDLSTLPAGEDAFDEILPDELTQADEGELPELSGDEELTELTLDEEFESEMQPAAMEVAESSAEDLLNLDEESESDLLEEMDTADDFLDSPISEEVTEDRSLNLLENIERELSSIRSELGDLKRELGELRALPVGAEPAPAPALAPATDEEAVGFFEESEDEDETIALTGTELDNIMNTAEFTEESGRPTEIEDVAGLTDASTLDELVPEANEPATPITEISLEEPSEQEELVEVDFDSTGSVVLVGSEDEVEVLAGMDIDAELADIEELEDTTESFTESAPSELEELDLGDEISDPDETSVSPDDDLVLDAEPLDELDLSDESALDLSVEMDLSEDPGLPADPAIPPEPTTMQPDGETDTALPDNLKSELRSVLRYMDQLLESLPEEKIQEFAQSDHFTVYRRLFEELGLEQ